MQRYRARFIISDGQTIDNGVLTVDGGKIVNISEGDYDTDLGDVIVVPGLVNAHSHAFQRSMRGRTEYLDKGHESDDFWSWRSLMYQEAARQTPELIGNVARLAFLEMVLSGVTAVGEFHYVHHRPNGTPYDDPNELANQVIQAALDVGIHITLLNVAYHRGGFQRALVQEQFRFVDDRVDDYLQRTDALAQAWQREGRVAVGYAPHSIRAVPSTWLSEIVNAARRQQRVIHIHACEQRAELEQAMGEYGRGPIAVFEELGLFEVNSTLVHATHIDDSDVQRLKGTSASVCLCPTTERNLGDGFAPADLLFHEQIPVCLGTDSQIQIDLWEDARQVEYQQRLLKERRNVLAPYAPSKLHPGVLSLDTGRALWPTLNRNGAHSIGLNSGALSAGQNADFITLDLGHPSFVGFRPQATFGQLVFGVQRSAVRDVFVRGEQIVRAGRHAQQDAIIKAYREAL